jgi:hypothetical protein
MELLRILVLLLRDVLTLALFLVGLICTYHGDPRLNRHTGTCFIALAASLSMILLDRIIVYPRFRSPLRKLPIVRVSMRKLVMVGQF